MKITRLAFENFRSYTNVEIPLPNRITVLRGANHVGKSTIEQGIQYALAARSESTNAAGAGADEYLIRQGADIGRVFLDIDIDGKVDRLRATISRKTGRTLATKDADGVDSTNDVNPWLRKHADVICCLTNSRYFVDLEPSKQKDILSGIVLPERYDGWDDEMIAASEKVGMESRAFYLNEHPFKVIGRMYDMAFEKRKEVNRDIKNFVAPSTDFTDAGDVAEIRAKLTERRSQLTAAQTKRATALAEFTRISSQRAMTVKRIEAAEAKIAAEQKDLTAYTAAILDKKALKTNKDAAAQGKHAAALDVTIATLEVEVKMTREAQLKLDALAEACPTCSQAITEEVKTTILKPLVDKMHALAADLRRAKDQRATVGDFTLAQTALDDHARAEKEVIRTTERLKEAETELAGADEDLEAIGPAQEVDTTEVDAEIADLTERIEKGTTHLQLVTAANERKIAHDKAVERMNGLKERKALLEKLVDYFGPAGVQAKLLQEHVGAFTASMNAVLEAWGYECVLSFEPNFFFGVITRSPDCDRVWSLKTLSKSERYRFAIAFQVALAMHTGFRFVVVDETDMLDGEGRKGLMQQILSSELDQAILLGTDERPTISPGMAAAADFFMVSAGLVDGIPTSSVARLHAAV